MARHSEEYRRTRHEIAGLTSSDIPTLPPITAGAAAGGGGRIISSRTTSPSTAPIVGGDAPSREVRADEPRAVLLPSILPSIIKEISGFSLPPIASRAVSSSPPTATVLPRIVAGAHREAASSASAGILDLERIRRELRSVYRDASIIDLPRLWMLLADLAEYYASIPEGHANCYAIANYLRAVEGSSCGIAELADRIEGLKQKAQSAMTGRFGVDPYYFGRYLARVHSEVSGSIEDYISLRREISKANHLSVFKLDTEIGGGIRRPDESAWADAIFAVNREIYDRAIRHIYNIVQLTLDLLGRRRDSLTVALYGRQAVGVTRLDEHHSLVILSDKEESELPSQVATLINFAMAYNNCIPLHRLGIEALDEIHFKDEVTRPILSATIDGIATFHDGKLKLRSLSTKQFGLDSIFAQPLSLVLSDRTAIAPKNLECYTKFLQLNELGFSEAARTKQMLQLFSNCFAIEPNIDAIFPQWFSRLGNIVYTANTAEFMTRRSEPLYFVPSTVGRANAMRRSEHLLHLLSAYYIYFSHLNVIQEHLARPNFIEIAQHINHMMGALLASGGFPTIFGLSCLSRLAISKAAPDEYCITTHERECYNIRVSSDLLFNEGFIIIALLQKYYYKLSLDCDYEVAYRVFEKHLKKLHPARIALNCRYAVRLHLKSELANELLDRLMLELTKVALPIQELKQASWEIASALAFCERPTQAMYYYKKAMHGYNEPKISNFKLLCEAITHEYRALRHANPVEGLVLNHQLLSNLDQLFRDLANVSLKTVSAAVLERLLECSEFYGMMETQGVVFASAARVRIIEELPELEVKVANEIAIFPLYLRYCNHLIAVDEFAKASAILNIFKAYYEVHLPGNEVFYISCVAGLSYIPRKEGRYYDAYELILAASRLDSFVDFPISAKITALNLMGLYLYNHQAAMAESEAKGIFRDTAARFFKSAAIDAPRGHYCIINYAAMMLGAGNHKKCLGALMKVIGGQAYPFELYYYQSELANLDPIFAGLIEGRRRLLPLNSYAYALCRGYQLSMRGNTADAVTIGELWDKLFPKISNSTGELLKREMAAHRLPESSLDARDEVVIHVG